MGYSSQGHKKLDTPEASWHTCTSVGAGVRIPRGRMENSHGFLNLQLDWPAGRKFSAIDASTDSGFLNESDFPFVKNCSIALYLGCLKIWRL